MNSKVFFWLLVATFLSAGVRLAAMENSDFLYGQKFQFNFEEPVIREFEAVTDSGESVFFSSAECGSKSLSSVYNFLRQLQETGFEISKCCFYMSVSLVTGVVFQGIPQLWELFLYCRDLSGRSFDDEWCNPVVDPYIFNYTKKLVEKKVISEQETIEVIERLQGIMSDIEITDENLLNCLASYFIQIT